MEQMTLDQVRRELADIHDQLLSLPADAFDQRAVLMDRQNALRQLSRRLLEEVPIENADILRAEFTRLQEVRDRLLEQRISGASIGGDALWGEFSLVINKAIDAGVGTDQIEARIKEIFDKIRSSS